ncbi:class I SAM-dependent methyltransferase [Polyangium jinanense]|uniref:Class I SAM-dependent methyltransferase n=1 Tax=Polyangium jinanense TaxID=2829994 RepID=A0A9X3XF47_9BACT|nr:class I SAM-dependent methyltransferase [Polyangium jinanense]MDC3960593.1 class I SAM-dependent methyltransferase [Polyangium jinanense]MDC3986881.1 class I SAM-dependent methyltransferase [Polyangium jinanense]
MDTKKVRLTKDKETYLATLYGKALDATAPNTILGDRFAADAVARIDYDFEELKLPSGGAITLPLRARHFDQWTRAFLAEYPSSTVLHLGCGLDTRVYRIDPGPEVRWYDVDFPDVIALREKLYPEREGYRRIGTSVTDLAWLDAIPGDTPVLVVAEGLFMYLHEKDGAAVLQRITEQFPSGQVVFDGYSAAMVRLVSRLATVRGAKVELVWGIDDPHDLEKHVPKLRLVESVAFLTMPDLVERLSKSRFSSLMHGVMGRLPFYRHLVRHLRYAF